MMKKARKKTRQIVTGAVIAALYVTLTYVSTLLGLSSGVIQCRISEALCVLPIFTPFAIPGLFVGCVISNMLAGGVVWDVVFGSAATLIGAYFTRLVYNKTSNVVLSLMMPVISNAVIVPLVLKFAYGAPDAVPFMVLTVSAGEIISCTILGCLLYKALINKARFLFNL